MPDRTDHLLPPSRMPRTWYNFAADAPDLAPMLHPATGRPVTVDDLAGIMPTALAEQELSRERELEIPEPVREIYARWRPTPLYRARRLEQALSTPARIYYKYEGVSPAGSHKPNTAVPQAFYNHEAGIRRLATETGAGQWGSSLAYAGALFGLDVDVFMVRVSYEQKPYRRVFMETFGASCTPSPSPRTAAGRAVLAATPDSPGSLGIATSEALEVAGADPLTNYAGGSVLNHVAVHQSVIGLETHRQFELADDYPDVVIACAGGGSNAAGLLLPFVGSSLRGGPAVRAVAAEPAACPSLTRGKLAYDFGDTAGLTPLLRMHTLGHGFVPPPLHAGGLRYHGMAPLLSCAVEAGLVEAVAVEQSACFASGLRFARAEGLIPAPESTHAVHVAISEAVRAREEGVARTIVFGLSGHGMLDLGAYDRYLHGELGAVSFSEDEMARSLAELPDPVEAR